MRIQSLGHGQLEIPFEGSAFVTVRQPNICDGGIKSDGRRDLVTIVHIALLLLHLVRQKVAPYAIESSLRHYLKYVLTSPATTCVRADTPLEPVSLAVHRALVLIAGLWQRKGAIRCVTRVLGARLVRPNSHSVGSSGHPAAAFLRAVAEVAPLADAVDGALMGVALLSLYTGVWHCAGREGAVSHLAIRATAAV
jgi:hypothetical protein